MKVILCRLGESQVLYYVQKRWFELNGITNMFPIYIKSVKLTSDDIEKYKDKNIKKNVDCYSHTYKVMKPNDNCCNYYYCNNEELKLIQKNEILFSLLEKNDNNIEEYTMLFNEHFNFRHYGLDINDKNRTDPNLIKLIEEYCEICSGDEESWYGKYPMKVVEIPDDIEWEVDQPEGCNEIIREKHRVWGMNGLIK